MGGAMDPSTDPPPRSGVETRAMKDATTKGINICKKINIYY
jgi:hypothetical protein